MNDQPVTRYERVVRGTFIVILSYAALFYVRQSIDWSWQWDTSIMHYVNFMMDHGKAPYRDIIDINMPGSYFIEGWAMHVFGHGDLGWRLYEYSLLTVLTLSMIVIAWPYDWLAGLFGGVLYTLFHGAEGPINAVQREEVMTVLIMTSLAFAFSALRVRKPLLLLPFGLLAGLAVSLKPTVAPLDLLLLAMIFFALRKRGERSARYIGFSLVGFATAAAIIAGFLVRYHALSDFLDVTRRLIPYYASVGNYGPFELVNLLTPRPVLLFAPIVVIGLLLLYKEGLHNWERQALALATCFGAFSFFVQRKGFVYHRDPFMAFLFLWLALEFCGAMKTRGSLRRLGLIGAAGLLFLVPLYCRVIYAARPNSPLTDSLMQDLNRLGGPRLQNQVECFDMVSGCLGALYRLGLVQNMGFMGDYMFFGPPGSEPSPYYRDMFMKRAEVSPPKVIVLTTAGLSQPDSFAKIDQWPQFVNFLNSRYVLDVTRMEAPDSSRGYRIYLLKPEHAR